MILEGRSNPGHSMIHMCIATGVCRRFVCDLCIRAGWNLREKPGGKHVCVYRTPTCMYGYIIIKMTVFIDVKSIERSCPERLCCLYPWRISRPSWVKHWTNLVCCHSLLCLEQGVGLARSLILSHLHSFTHLSDVLSSAGGKGLKKAVNQLLLVFSFLTLFFF